MSSHKGGKRTMGLLPTLPPIRPHVRAGGPALGAHQTRPERGHREIAREVVGGGRPSGLLDAGTAGTSRRAT